MGGQELWDRMLDQYLLEIKDEATRARVKGFFEMLANDRHQDTAWMVDALDRAAVMTANENPLENRLVHRANIVSAKLVAAIGQDERHELMVMANTGLLMGLCRLSFVLGMLAERDGWCLPPEGQ